MTKKQARNARNQRNKERLWSDVTHRPIKSGSNSVFAFGDGDFMRVFSGDGVIDFDNISNEEASAIITNKAMELMEQR